MNDLAKRIINTVLCFMIVTGVIIIGVYGASKLTGLDGGNDILHVDRDIKECEHDDLIDVVIVEKNVESDFWSRAYVVVAKDEKENRYVFYVTQNAFYEIEIDAQYKYCQDCKKIFN